jgi:GTPase
VKVLRDLGVEDRPRLHVLNKVDRLSEDDLAALVRFNGHHPQSVFTSAVTGAGLDELLARMDTAMSVDPIMRLKLRLPVSDGRHLSLVQAGGRVLHSLVLDGDLLLEADVPQSLARKLEEFIDKAGVPLGASK